MDAFEAFEEEVVCPVVDGVDLYVLPGVLREGGEGLALFFLFFDLVEEYGRGGCGGGGNGRGGRGVNGGRDGLSDECEEDVALIVADGVAEACVDDFPVEYAELFGNVCRSLRVGGVEAVEGYEGDAFLPSEVFEVCCLLLCGGVEDECFSDGEELVENDSWQA